MGDDKWLVLYQAYRAYIYARCLKLLGDEAAAEDASQETFMRAYKHLAKVGDICDPLPWIYTIATSYCLTLLRDARRRAEPLDRLPECSSQHAEDSLGNRDFLQRLLRHVPEQVRVVARLHYLEGLEQAEVARVLGLARRTVVYRLAKLAQAAERLRAEETLRRAPPRLVKRAGCAEKLAGVGG